MHEPTYRDALKAGWQLAWRNKSLWVFGLFAAFLGQMGIIEIISKTSFAASGSQYYSLWRSSVNMLWDPSLWKVLFSVPFDQAVVVAWLLVMLVVLLVGFIAIAVISQGVLVHEAAKHIKHKRALERASSWDQGVNHFWRLLGLNVVKKLVLLFVMVFVGWGTVNALLNSSVFDRLLFLFLFLLATFVGMVVSLIVVYAAGYIIIEDYPLGRALESAWKLFWNHWLVSLEVGFIFLVLNVVLVVLAALGLYLFFLTIALFWMIGMAVNSTAVVSAGVLVGMFVFGFFLLFIGSVFTVFTTSSWTFLFMKMHREGIASRVMRWLKPR